MFMNQNPDALDTKRIASIFQPLKGDQSRPLYHQVEEAIRQAVARGILNPNDALPPERELAETFEVSRITIRKAISGLVSEGVLERRHGSGNFVRSKVEKNFAQLNSFTEEMAARGMSASSRWIGKREGVVRSHEVLTLRASPGTPVYRFERVRLADDAPMSIEKTTILAECLPSIDSVENSIYAALKKAGHRPVRALQRLHALILNAEQAELLGAHPGDAGLLVERLGFNDKGVAVEYSQSWYRGDTYDFVAELSLSE